MTTTDTLIQSLARENTGWSKPKPTVRFLVWLILGAVIVALGMEATWSGYRPGFVDDLHNSPHFLAEFLAGVLLCLALSFALAALARPGSLLTNPGSTPVLLVLGPTLLFVALIAAGLAYPSITPSRLGKRVFCVQEVIAYGIALSMVGGLLLRGTVVCRPLLTGMTLGIVAGLVPAVLMHISCMYSPAHNLIFHLGPILPLAGIGVLLCNRMNRRQTEQGRRILEQLQS